MTDKQAEIGPSRASTARFMTARDRLGAREKERGEILQKLQQTVKLTATLRLRSLDAPYFKL